ncbi:MAG: alpha-glucosidase/alpha-galactosidase [Planctomycetota bacterium]
MSTAKPKIAGLKIGYIGGGSQAWGRGLMNDLAQEPDLSGEVRLFDLDFAAAQRNERLGNRMKELPGCAAAWKYRAVKSLQACLTGADFVVISILPGSFAAMASDIGIPAKFGILHPVGDTVGPAGHVRALRTVPMYRVMAEAIAQYCPRAWVINYTNPMTVCTRTLYKIFPLVKAIGCCHEVFSTQHLFAQVVADQFKVEAPPRQEIEVNVQGINHFTWLDRVQWKGTDLIPHYSAYIAKHKKRLQREALKPNKPFDPFRNLNLVKMELFERFGQVAAAGDRHLAEFVPWFLRDPDTVRRYGFALTPVKLRVQWIAERTRKTKALLAGKAKVELHRSGEEGVLQIKALLGLGDMVTNVNMPNVGQLFGFPLNAVVETNARLSADSIQPLSAGRMVPQVEALVRRHVSNQETIIEAALHSDRELAFTAILNDPLTAIPIDRAAQMFDQMLKATKPWLPAGMLK